MKNKALTLIFTAMSFICFNCDKNGDAEKTIDDASKKVEEAVDNTVDKVKAKMEQNFVSKTLENNAEELEWLRAGSKMGTDPELIEVAKKMIPDHEKLAADLKTYAANKKLDINADTDQNVKIDSKTGATWDKEWAEKMRDKHRDMVDSFEKIQSNTEDQELKEFVTNTLPVLREHLNMTEKLETKLSK